MEAALKPAGAAGTVVLGDLSVKRAGFGAMRITGPGIWGEPANADAARRLLRRAVELGIDFIDTADSYGPEVSERLIREALHPYSDVVIATKGGFVRSGPDAWHRSASLGHLRGACEGSLERLGLERIDVYQLHAPDPNVSFAESVGTLAELRAEGKIRHVGLSNVSAEQLANAQAIVPIVSVQNRYNLGDRRYDDVLEACEASGIAFIPFFPLGAGDLMKGGGVLRTVARDRGVTLAQVALAWLFRRSPVMLPIPGTASERHLEENVEAAALRLTEAEFEALSDAHPDV